MIHPIETRYGRTEVKKIFDEENRLQKMLDVESALAFAHYSMKTIEKPVYEEISRKANINYVKISRVKEIEAEINHDLMAVVRALTEQCSDEAGKYIHLGATSNDIIDTATALQLKDFYAFMEEDLNNLLGVLIDLSEKNKNLVCIGRTHGQHAIPTTYGLKFAIYADEVKRHIDRLNECKQRILVGKLSGAVGTQATLGANGIKIQEIVMQKLGLKSPMVSNQLLQRDRYAEFFMVCALVAQTLNKISLEIRNLGRTEIDEVREGFKKEKQVGSSTMPQKRNPIIAERICGLSRIITADAFASFENIPLWHERDLTNSSAERIIIPEVCILTDYIINLAIDLLKNLEFNYENIKRNLNLTGGLELSEAVMIELTKKGVGRQEAHELVRKCAMECYETKKNFFTVLVESKEIGRFLSEAEIRRIMNPENYIGTAIEQVEQLVKKLRSEIHMH